LVPQGTFKSIEVAVTDSDKDPEIITSRHSGYVTKDDVTVELCIYRLEHTKWTLEELRSLSTVAVIQEPSSAGRRFTPARYPPIHHERA
jgi:hypothetical protein